MLDYMPNIVYNVAGTLSNKVYILFTWLGEFHSYWELLLRPGQDQFNDLPTFVWTGKSEQILASFNQLIINVFFYLLSPRALKH